jgi:hypothetical protein
LEGLLEFSGELEAAIGLYGSAGEWHPLLGDLEEQGSLANPADKALLPQYLRYPWWPSELVAPSEISAMLPTN